jgi:hypothetical protein
MEPARLPATASTSRPSFLRTPDDLTSTEFGKVSAAVDTLLDDKFVAVMDNPELPELLREFKTELDGQKDEREQLQASIAS